MVRLASTRRFGYVCTSPENRLRAACSIFVRLSISSPYREAREAGRVLSVLPLDEVRTDGLPRDRLDLDGVAASEEMEELKASIRARGQREAIEVYVDEGGRYQRKKGWRRLSALRALLRETGEQRFGTVVIRIGPSDEDRVSLYVDMVEENAVRQDLSFAEMAAVAMKAAQDPAIGSATRSSGRRRSVGILELRWPDR